MDQLFASLKIEVNPNIYLKDPESSDLGKRILSSSLLMIDEMGLEQFTFRKLAKSLNTTESSVYRYFESKHKLLLYFYNWYWGYMEYKIVYAISNIHSAVEKLRIAIGVLCMPFKPADQHSDMALFNLRSILISESSKAYLNKEVDTENKAGFFLAFKKVVRRLVAIVHEIDADYLYGSTLVATCLEGILHQIYFADHLPSLSDVGNNSEKLSDIFFQIIINNLNTDK